MRITNKQLPLVKAIFHFIGLAPIALLFYQVLNNQVGGEPVEYIIHYTGMGTINALVAVLLISPIAKHLKQAVLMKTRRLVGLYVFAYANLHILSFISLDLLFEWQLLFSEIIKRPYIIVGMLAYIILTLLALTSIDKIKRKMGKQWQRLHNFIYAAALLTPIHFYWSVKSEIIEPSIYIALMIALLLARLKWRRGDAKTKAQLKPN